jgi:Na+-transporting methylmalonyl-CoA/oxaloacetate decarboxylase beta subunit
MYTALLTVHSYLRWLILIAALLVIARAIGGVFSKRPWGRADDVAAKVFGHSLDLQMLIGLIIYIFLSPFTGQAFADFGAMMRDPALRLIMIEHQVGMFIALALAHIGLARIRKSADLVHRHKIALAFFALALVVMMASIPWPGRPGGRPLLRGVTDVVE